MATGYCGNKDLNGRLCLNGIFKSVEGGSFCCVASECGAMFVDTAVLTLVDDEGNFLRDVEVKGGKEVKSAKSRSRITTLPRIAVSPSGKSPDEGLEVSALDETPPAGTENPFEADGVTEVFDMGQILLDAAEVFDIDPNLLLVPYDEGFARVSATHTSAMSDKSDTDQPDEGGVPLREIPMAKVHKAIAAEVERLNAEKLVGQKSDPSDGEATDALVTIQTRREGGLFLEILSGTTSSKPDADPPDEERTPAEQNSYQSDGDTELVRKHPTQKDVAEDLLDKTTKDEIHKRLAVDDVSDGGIPWWLAFVAVVLACIVALFIISNFMGDTTTQQVQPYSNLTQCVEVELRESGLDETMEGYLVVACKEQGYE